MTPIVYLMKLRMEGSRGELMAQDDGWRQITEKKYDELADGYPQRRKV